MEECVRSKQFLEEQGQQEHAAHPVNVVDDATMLLDVVRKRGRYSEEDEDMQNILREGNDQNQYHIIADDLEVSAMTQDEMDDIEECLEDIKAFCLSKDDLLFYKDKLISEEELSDFETEWDTNQEDNSYSLEASQSQGVASFIKDMKKDEFSCHPYILCQKFIRENELCFLDIQSTEPKLCIFNGKYWQELDDEELRQRV